MIILGCDIATKTGFALRDTHKPESAIQAWTFKVKAKQDEAKARELGREMVRIMRHYKPDFVAIESPLKFVKQYQKSIQTLHGPKVELTVDPSTVIVSNQLCGAVMAVIGVYSVPWVAIPVQTWRKHFLGFGTQKGWTREDWKKAAKDRCDRLRIQVGDDDNAAEAAGIAWAAPATDAFKMFLHKRAA